MPIYKHAADGRTINVSGYDVEKQYAADTMWSLVAEKPVPDGEPAADWTVAQLTTWAGDNDVEVPAGPKGAVVEAVMAALAERAAKNQD